MTPDARELQDWIGAVHEGRWSRRQFVERLATLGLPAPMAAGLLGLPAATARAQSSARAYRPKQRGGGGVLRILSWQGATLLNPHFSSGSKDHLAGRLFYEPLATWDIDGNLHPVLLTEVPTPGNGGVAADGLSVTCQLKRGVSWHDGQPFGADDVVFTWEFLRDPAAAAFTLGTYQPVTLRKVDSHTVRIVFDKPTPYWADVLTGHVLPRHHFSAYLGSRSREAPANLRPVGTGPYRIGEFRPGDLLRATANTAYHMPNRPHFDAVEIKGGGDSVSAARTVLQTGEYDIAWLLQVEDEVLQHMEASGRGRGRIHAATGGDTEFILLNQADPWTEVDGERSNPKSRHPLFQDPAVRQALALLVDRPSIQQFIYGRSGTATPNIVNNPARYHSRNLSMAFDVARANAVLDGAGWSRAAGGIRAKAGRPLKLLYHTTVNAPRQKTQSIVKQAAAAAGIEIELKATVASVYFSSDVANPDTLGKFAADLQMHTTTRAGPDPWRFMEQFCSWLAASKGNKWLGRNTTRWKDAAFDRAFRAAETELDPVKRAALIITMNDRVCSDHAVIPIVARAKVTAVARDVQAPISGWGVETGLVHDWYRGPA